VAQQDCRIAQHALSPLVQVMQQPSFVLSHLQMPQVRLHWHTVKPLSVQQQEHKPPASALHRFCNVAQATSSSQWQLILNPPLHFSILRVQRGTTHQPAAGAPADKPAGEGETADAPAAPKNSPRSNTIVLDIDSTPFKGRFDKPPPHTRATQLFDRLWNSDALRPTLGRTAPRETRKCRP
jgi:hypothetical protein